MKAPLSPVDSAPLLAVSFLVPTRLMLRSSRVASPLVSVLRVVVPLSVPVPVLMVMATATPGTPFPKASCACTVTAGLSVAPACASPGG